MTVCAQIVACRLKVVLLIWANYALGSRDHSAHFWDNDASVFLLGRYEIHTYGHKQRPQKPTMSTYNNIACQHVPNYNLGYCMLHVVRCLLNVAHSIVSPEYFGKCTDAGSLLTILGKLSASRHKPTDSSAYARIANILGK